ncbi:MAG: hypothetical protein HOY79_29895 [Streptomyces sp.]|nr:hypothetical protein [Streptomyces sp.]
MAPAEGRQLEPVRAARNAGTRLVARRHGQRRRVRGAQLALTRTIDRRAEKLLAAQPAPDEVKQLEKAPEDHQDLM